MYQSVSQNIKERLKKGLLSFSSLMKNILLMYDRQALYHLAISAAQLII